MGLFGKDRSRDKRVRKNRSPEVEREIREYLSGLREKSDPGISFKALMAMTSEEKLEANRLREP